LGNGLDVNASIIVLAQNRNAPLLPKQVIALVAGGWSGGSAFYGCRLLMAFHRRSHDVWSGCSGQT
jgi:hypothetical protein